MMYPGTFLKMVIGSGLSPQTHSFRSSGCSYRGLRRPLHATHPPGGCPGPWSLPFSPTVWADLCRSLFQLRNFCLRKRPSFLASRRFATGKSAADALMMYPGYAILYVRLNGIFPVWVFDHWVLIGAWCLVISYFYQYPVSSTQ